MCVCVCVCACVCVYRRDLFQLLHNTQMDIYVCIQGPGGEEKGEDVEGKRKREERSLGCGVNNWFWGLGDGMAYEGCRGGQGFGLRRVGGRAASGKCRWGGK
jgi:hypothetical protein